MKTDSSQQLLTDVEAYCQELRPIEELCYVEHRYNEQTVELAKKHEPVYAAVGIQPNYVAEARPGDWETIERLSLLPKVVAIGERWRSPPWRSP